MTIEMIPIAGSTNVDAVGYDAEAGELRVQFRNGATYVAFNVPPEDHEKFMTADSKGKYFGKLRGLHNFSRMQEKETNDGCHRRAVGTRSRAGDRAQ